ncbi:hypothetical protein [uncultured Litoreibacter sp.]|nr:hypothetical protein [uncultured Litoreibacter sp.]
MSQNIYFFGQTGLPDPAIWEVALGDLKVDYTVDVEEREDASPVYGEVFLDGEDLIQFELYTAMQTAKGFDGESGASVFAQEIELAKTQKAGGSPELIAELNKTTEILVLAIAAEDQSDEQLARNLEPFLDWLHATSKGLHYVDGTGFYDATARL